MDVLIKRKNYAQMIEFLNENAPDSDWKIFLECLKTNEDLLQFVINFLNYITCPFKLKLFLVKVFSLNNKDLKLQNIIYNIITNFLQSENEMSHHELIRNLLLAQTLKISIIDEKFKENLKVIINNLNVNDGWFIELLDKFEFNEELGYYYEIDDNKLYLSLKYYEKAGNNQKVEEIQNRLKELEEMENEIENYNKKTNDQMMINSSVIN